MVIKTVKGTYKIIKNYREAFNETAFIEKYIEECMDKYPFIVGDISSGILRLKGFDRDPKSKNYFGFIDDYLESSCAFGCPFYVLRRIKHEQELKQNDSNVVTVGEFNITPIVKENFDKESIILQTTPKSKPNIVLDLKKINSLPKGTLSADLQEIVKQEKTIQQPKTVVTPKEEVVVTSTYVSASPDFDPTKVVNRNKPKGKPNNNNNNQNNNNNNQNNNNNNQNNNSNKHKNHKKHNKKKQ